MIFELARILAAVYMGAETKDPIREGTAFILVYMQTLQ